MTKARTLADNFAADINGITAGTGITGGGTSGTVTVTNEMATIIDAKGDLVGGTGADTFARLAVGANGETLVADSSTSTGLAWKTAAAQYPVQSWTPSWTNFTTGNGTLNYANYIQVGKLVYFTLRFTLGSTSAMGTDPTFTLPITGQSGVDNLSLCLLLDAGTATYSGKCEALATLGYLTVFNSAGTYVADSSITATVPFTWTTNDRIYASGSYTVA
jgi:hypothetical protein